MANIAAKIIKLARKECGTNRIQSLANGNS